MADRKLASIQKIVSIDPIPDADAIEKATVLGWECVVAKKDNFKIGDLVVYIEVDSIVPEKPEFEFLRDRKFRVRTIKLRKQISQGLILPITVLPSKNYKENDDVTGIIGVRKYDPQSDLERKLAEQQAERTNSKIKKFLLKNAWYRKLFVKAKQGFPSFIKKTDEDRIQLFPHICENEKDTTFQVTEKIDGCVSGRTMIKTDHGDMKIQTIVNKKSPVRVLTYNESSKEVEFKNILDYHKINANRETYRIGVGYRGKGNRKKFIECTDNHRFFTQRGWVSADNLSENDVLYHYSKGIPYEIKQMLIGCLLGDSSISSNSNTGNYRSIIFNHSKKQLGYFNYKKTLLGSLMIGEHDVTSGYGSELICAHTITNLDILKLLNDNCIIENKKTITDQWANQIDPIALAFWYMDDGSIFNREDNNLKSKIIFNTQGFSIEEVKILKDMFAKKYNIDAIIGDKNIYKGYVLIINTGSAEKLFSIMAPYICQSMKYKLPKKYENMPCFFENKTFSDFDSIVETKVLSIEKGVSCKFGNYVFDLSIEDNENYFANNILVHNCSATFFLVKQPKFKFLGFEFGKEYVFGVCSRNIYLKKPNNSSYWTIAKQCDIEKTLRSLIRENKYIILQGEIVGDGIQKNKYEVNGYDFYAFNLLTDVKKYNNLEMRMVLNDYHIKAVPLIDRQFELLPTIPEMVDYAKGKSVVNKNILREGVVIRNYDKEISFKVINPEFLLKYSE